MRVKSRQLSLFTLQLSVMLRVGIHIYKALEILGGTHPMACELRARVERGKSLSDAMALLPRVFNPVYVNLVRVGERTGALVEILDRLAATLHQIEDRRGRLTAALIYPCFVLLTSLAIVGFLVVYMLPRLLDVVGTNGGELPWPTRVLAVVAGNKLVWAIPLGLVLLGLAWYSTAGQTPAGRLLIQRLQYETPGFGKLFLDELRGRLCRQLGLALAQGVPMLDALAMLSTPTCGYRAMDLALGRLRRRLSEGAELGEALRQEPLFPLMMAQILSVGESTGRLPEFLVHYAGMLDMAVELSVQSLMQLIEPLLLMFMGALVGFIVVAAFLPMYRLVQL